MDIEKKIEQMISKQLSKVSYPEKFDIDEATKEIRDLITEEANSVKGRIEQGIIDEETKRAITQRDKEILGWAESRKEEILKFGGNGCCMHYSVKQLEGLETYLGAK